MDLLGFISLHVWITGVVIEIWCEFDANSLISCLIKPLMCPMLPFPHVCVYFWHLKEDLEGGPSLNTVLEEDIHLQGIIKKIMVGLYTISFIRVFCSDLNSM